VLLRMSTLFLRTLRENPAEAEVPSHALLVRAGFIRRVAPGSYSWLPLGKRVLDKITTIVHEELAAVGAQEVCLPALVPPVAYEQSGRWPTDREEIFRLKDRRGADYLLAPSHGELMALLVKELYASHKDYPVTLYQIQTTFRDEPRVRAGLLRAREFLTLQSYSFDLSDAGRAESYARHRAAYARILDRLGLDYTIAATAKPRSGEGRAASRGADPSTAEPRRGEGAADPDTPGGAAAEEFLAPAPVGDKKYVVCSRCDYAATTEAVVTPAPPPGDPGAWPALSVHDTPDTPTIESLVALANAQRLGGRADWTAADTLKNVVLTVIPPGGEPEVLVIGVPGDREIDLNRLEASLYPARVALFEAADFAATPELVRGYIGPQSAALAGSVGAPARRKFRYLVDPRVVTGTSWLTGANEEGRHAVHVVAGRDFTPDGTIEAAEVRTGDPCPRCGAGDQLTLRPGIAVGRLTRLGHRVADAFGLDALGPDGKPVRITMGGYTLGVSRLVAAIAEQHHDDKGLAWPAAVAPAHVHIVPAGPRTRGEGSVSEHLSAALTLGTDLSAAGVDVIVDDRPGVSVGVRLTDAELIGAPWIVVVGRRLPEGVVEVRHRASGEAEDLPLGELVARITQWVGEARRPSPTSAGGHSSG
jgi:prolyl-tRNA synthetase